MPWWLNAYLLGYALFTAWWVRDDVQDGRSGTAIAAELASDACMVVAALGYWLDSVRGLLGDFALPVFVVGLAWLLAAAVQEFRERAFDPALSRSANFAIAVSGAALFAAVCGPLIYWGFSYAVLEMYAAA